MGHFYEGDAVLVTAQSEGSDQADYVLSTQPLTDSIEPSEMTPGEHAAYCYYVDAGGGLQFVDTGTFSVFIDIDQDHLPDADEQALIDADPNDDIDLLPTQDSDGDGLTNAEELQHGTDMGASDSDGDGVNDGDEVAGGTDPIVPDDGPNNFTLSISRGGGAGYYTSGFDVSVDASDPVPGFDWSHWTVTPSEYTANLADASAISTTFTMPTTNVMLTASYKLDPNEDYDGDGLLNSHEEALGSNPLNADSDGDRMNDGDEWIAGTSMTNAASVLMVACDVQLDGSRLISWYGVNGRYYTFEYCDSLTQPWKTYPFELPGGDIPITLLDSYDGEGSFYRVKVRKP